MFFFGLEITVEVNGYIVPFKADSFHFGGIEALILSGLLVALLGLWLVGTSRFVYRRIWTGVAVCLAGVIIFVAAAIYGGTSVWSEERDSDKAAAIEQWIGYTDVGIDGSHYTAFDGTHPVTGTILEIEGTEDFIINPDV